MKSFTVKNTNITKGVACILLLTHHLFYSPVTYERFYHIFGIDNPPLVTRISLLSKVCVAMFVILSGYGLTKSFEKGNECEGYFVYKHFVKLLCDYWFIFIIFVPLGFVFGRNPIKIYGGGIRGIVKFLIDFFGLANLFGTPTMNATWWYMGAVTVLYLIFPILRKSVKKLPYFSLVISAVICFCQRITRSWYHPVFAWILPFVVGIFLAQEGVLDRIADTKYKKTLSLISLIFIVIIAVLRYKFSVLSIKIDTFFSLSIIIFTLVSLSNTRYINTTLEFIGIHSANIFFMHTFIYKYYFCGIIYSLHYPILMLMNLLAVSLAVSVGIEKLKKILNYDKVSEFLLGLVATAKWEL